jgi:hypothetical protein
MLIRAVGPHDWRNTFSRLDITVDGQPTIDVCEADDEAGYVVVLARGPDGNLIADGDQWRTSRISGKVMFHGQRRADTAIPPTGDAA